MFAQHKFPRFALILILLISLCASLFAPQVGDAEAKPLSANALDVIINEIAWGGTSASTADEWIELYNTTGTDIDLSGWTLISSDLTPSINLTGIIPAGGYYLLEQTDDNTVFDITADQIYSGALSNAGETLNLTDNLSNIIDTANISGGSWDAGSGTPNFYSMERIGVVLDSSSAWQSNNGIIRNGLDANGNPTINGTPGQQNSAAIPTATPTDINTPTSTLTPTITFTPTETETPTNTSTITQTSTVTNTPSSTGALSVLINEVAWSGTSSTRTNDEWIELHNTMTSAINLNNWVLTIDDGTSETTFVTFNATDSISAGGFFILARANSSGNFDIFTNVVEDKAFNVALPNTSTTVLRLYNQSGALIDTANSGKSTGWYAGTASSTYASMERRGKVLDGLSAWYTFGGTPFAFNRDGAQVRGTPRTSNWAISVTPTATSIRTATRTPTQSRTPTITIDARLVINEILPRPGFDWNQDGRTDVYDEFIEIKNLSPINVDMQGWRLDTGNGAVIFSLPNGTLAPNERIVFYSAETNLLLSDGGETVRLLNPSGRIYDAYTYTVAKEADKSICRLPDGNVYGGWFDDCLPTPNLSNTREGSVPTSPDGNESVVCNLPDTIPADFFFAECGGYGANIWNPLYWDTLFKMFIQNNTTKWESFIE